MLLAAPFVALAVLWPDLPARIPTHWGVGGQVDGWSSRAFGGLLLPVTNVGAYLLMLYLPRLDPRMKKGVEGNTLAVLGIVRLSMVALLSFLFGVQMAVALGVPIDSGRLIINGLLVFLLVVGNFFGSLRPNYFVGIRTPWTLESPETWRATHRVGGRILVFGSLLLMGLQFVVPNISAAFMVFVLGLAVWSMVYSWSYHRTHAAG
ncbi:SdpI family protein [soil metagenome]